jgi:hypothetical protein
MLARTMVKPAASSNRTPTAPAAIRGASATWVPLTLGLTGNQPELDTTDSLKIEFALRAIARLLGRRLAREIAFSNAPSDPHAGRHHG